MDREGLAPTKSKTSDLQSLPVATWVTIQTGLIGFEPITVPLTAECTTVVLQTIDIVFIKRTKGFEPSVIGLENRDSTAELHSQSTP